MTGHDITEAVDITSQFPTKEGASSITEPRENQPFFSLDDVKKFAQLIDSCSSFYALYGLLDGLSVSYSTLKFLCEISTSSSKEYNEWLETLLFAPAWLAVVITSSVFIAGLSLIANYLEKYKTAMDKQDKPLYPVWDQLCIYLKECNVIHLWEYIRNISKGVKNGYKGTKGFIALFLALGMLSKDAYKSIYFPISLVVGVICAINRTWNISMKFERSRLSKNCDKAIMKVGDLNEFLEKKQAHKNRLRSLSLRIQRINELVPKAKKLGIRTFSLDNDISRQANKSLRETQSSSELLSTIDKMPDKMEIENQLRKLLTSPEVSDQYNLINSLKAAIKEEKNKGKLPEKFSKMKHPLIEKLVKEQKRLDELKKEFNADTLYGLTDLKAMFKKEESELALLISKQKNNDKKVILALLEESSELKNFWREFNLMLTSLNKDTQKHYEDNQSEFKSKIKLLHKRIIIEKDTLKKLSIDSDGYKKSKQKIMGYETAIVNLFDEYKLSNAFGAQLVFRHLANETYTLQLYARSIQSRFLLSNIIAGIVDAPYLYIGIMSLALITSHLLLLALTLSVISFTIISVFFRAYEEVESNNACELQVIKVNIAQCDNKWKLAQNNYYKAYAKFKSEHNISQIDGTDYAQLFLKETSDANIIPALIAAYNESQAARMALKEFVNPSYYSAMMHGAKDALSLFGAIASSFYALNILLLAFGCTFPPVLIIAAVSIGLASIIGFIALRLSVTHQMKQELSSRFQRMNVSQDDFYHDKPSYPLGWADVNTDGLTKGEFFFQELHEIARSVCAGLGGKANNLMDFLFSHYKDKASDNDSSIPFLIMAFTVVLSLVYGAVLALRAFSKGFKKMKTKKTEEEIDLESGSPTGTTKAQLDTVANNDSIFSKKGGPTYFTSHTQQRRKQDRITDSPVLIPDCSQGDEPSPLAFSSATHF